MAGKSGKIGDVSPDFIMGFINSFKYKWITLSAQLDWKQGGDIYSGSNRLMALYGSAGFTEDRTTPFRYQDTENAKGVGVLSDGVVNDIVRGDIGEALPRGFGGVEAGFLWMRCGGGTFGRDLEKWLAPFLGGIGGLSDIKTQNRGHSDRRPFFPISPQ
jgi:hypothetical protein